MNTLRQRVSRAIARLSIAVDWRWRHLMAKYEVLDCIGRAVDRLVLMRPPREPSGIPLVRSYCAHYGIPLSGGVTEAMIQRHWSLERQLTARLLQSRSEERTGVFEDCYGQLYRELGWLNAMIETARPASVKTRLQETWASWIGAPPLRVYEIGAGKGELSAYLAGNGYTCRAAEVTAERGAKWVGRDVKGLTWGTTDGVDLARYETAGSFDVVISDQVVEHLRPEDLVRHMEGARMLLKPGGRYIVRTPHRFCGPWDVSRVFKRPFACGMHLKEYTYAELHKALAEGGFCRIGVAAAGRPEGSRRRLCLYECVEQIVKRLAFQELRGRLMALAERGSWMDSQIAMVGNTKAACR